MKVTLYTQPGCGLCAEAEAMLQRLRGKIQFTLELVDINADRHAYDMYWARIPVIAVDGEEVAEAPLDESGSQQS